MTKNDEVSIGVSASGVNLSSSGSSTNELVQAIIDFISPATQSAGLIGDFVRVFRQRNAIEAMQRTKALAVERGIEIKPVTPKFLFDWVEKSSLEDAAEKELQQAWSGLLLSASQIMHPTLYFFKRAISDFSREHLDFIEFVSGKQIDFSQSIVKAGEFEYCFSVAERDVKIRLDGNVRDQIFDWATQSVKAGVVVSTVGLHYNDGHLPAPEMPIVGAKSQIIHTAEMNGVAPSLISCGFLAMYSAEFEVFDDEFFGSFTRKYPQRQRGFLVVTVAYLTPLGRQFVMACNGLALP